MQQHALRLTLLALLVAAGLSCGTGEIDSSGDFPGEAVNSGDRVASTTLNPDFYDFLFISDSTELATTTRLDFTPFTFEEEQHVRIANRAFQGEDDADRLPEEAQSVLGLLNVSSPVDAPYQADVLAQFRLSEARSAGQRFRVWKIPLDADEWTDTGVFARVGQSGQVARAQLPTGDPVDDPEEEEKRGVNALYGVFAGSTPGSGTAVTPTVESFSVSSSTVATGGELQIEVELEDPADGPTLVLLDDGTETPHGEFSAIEQTADGATITHSATWTAPDEAGERTITLRATNRTGGYTETNLSITVTGSGQSG